MDFFNWRKEASLRYKTPIRIEENDAFVPEKSPGVIRDLCRGLNGKIESEKDALVICADQYCDFSLALFLLFCMCHPEAPFLVVHDLKDKSLASRYGVVEINASGKVNQFKERPMKSESNFVNAGIYYLPYGSRPRIYEYIQNAGFTEQDGLGEFFNWLSEKEMLYGVPFDGKRVNIRDIKSYEKVRVMNHE